MASRVATWTLAFGIALTGPVHAQGQTLDAGIQGPAPGRVVDSPTATDWESALTNSLRLLAIEHFSRIAFQDKTRRELGGPFFGDYRLSLKRPDGWSDGDGWLVNYVGHPIHGAAAGYVYLGARREDEAAPSLSKAFWVSRGQAALFAAGYSLQFELGPLSEASIGNVGMRPHTTGWVDHVVTPVGALGLIVAEDWLDRTVIVRIESWTRNRLLRVLVRIALNPSRAFALTAQGEMPWYRRGRPLR